MVNFILKFIDLFSGILKTLGVDYDQLRIILWVKLTMDSRKASGIRRSGKKKRNALAIQVIIYSIIGIFMGAFIIAQINSIFASGVIFFAFIMVMTAVALISEFTTVLIDTSDNTILLPRPVDSRTILIAKVIHIAVYLMIISLSLSLVSLIIVFIKFGVLSGLIFLVNIFLATLFSIFLTNLFYLGLMKVASGEKLKDIIAYFQIFMAIIIVGAYQIIPRITERVDMANISIDVNWWTFFIPPAWMAGTVDAFTRFDFGNNNIIFLSSAVVFPLLGLWLVVRFFAPGFNKSLSRLDEERTKTKRKIKIEKKQNLQMFLANIFTRNASEAISFILTWKLSSRDRKFKQSVYPSFGYVVIFIAVFFLQRNEDAGNIFEGITESGFFYVFMYFPVFIVFAVLASLRYSDQFKAAWIYEAFPVENPGNILSGGLKAVLIKLFFPFYVVMGIIVILIWGPQKLPDVLLAFFNILLFVSLMSRLTIFYFPFSQERLIQESGKNFAKTLLSMFFTGLVFGLHFLLNYLNINLFLVMPIIILVMIMIFRSYRLLSWEAIKNKT